MIAVDKMPLSTVQNEGFKLLMKTVAPLYIVPSRKTVIRLIDVRYDVLKERFIATLKEIDSYSITCDNWTDVGNQSYLGVTIHYVTPQIEMKSGCVGVFPLSENHTSQYLGECLTSVIKDFNLELSKITALRIVQPTSRKLYATSWDRTNIWPVLRILYLISYQTY